MDLESGVDSPVLEANLTWSSSSDSLWAGSRSQRAAACALRGGGGGGTGLPAAARLLGETKGAASSSDAAGGTPGSEHVSSNCPGSQCTQTWPFTGMAFCAACQPHVCCPKQMLIFTLSPLLHKAAPHPLLYGITPVMKRRMAHARRRSLPGAMRH